jgi:hypothetical protein
MNLWFSFVISLLLTFVVSFTTPILFCGLILGILAMVSCLPEFALFGQMCYSQVLSFLTVFGSGSVSNGIFTIALTCGIAGFLFEAFNFYRYQILINPISPNNQLE